MCVKVKNTIKIMALGALLIALSPIILPGAVLWIVGAMAMDMIGDYRWF